MKTPPKATYSLTNQRILVASEEMKTFIVETTCFRFQEPTSIFVGSLLVYLVGEIEA
jgi:hypothetical protein